MASAPAGDPPPVTTTASSVISGAPTPATAIMASPPAGDTPPPTTTVSFVTSGAPTPATATVALDKYTITGTLPGTKSFAVHYPGYPSSTARAVETLGGLPAIAHARAADSNRLDLRFRPEDPYCHPLSADFRPCTGLLLKLSTSNDALSGEVVARVNTAYHFDGMADYQHVIPVHAAEAARKKRQRDVEAETGDDELCPDPEDVMMLLPDLFSLKNMPEDLALTPSVSMFSKSFQKGVVEHRWEMDIEPCLKLAFDIHRIPVKVNWEDNIQRDTKEWEWQMAVSKLFEERPIWPRWSLHERLLDDGILVTEQQLKRLLFLAGYYFSTGPFGQFWIRKGYDPRKDPESRIFQKVDFRVPAPLRNLVDENADTKLKQTRKDLCHFRAFPSKIFVCLQLCELVDDFIQEEIRKPIVLATCSPSTGWFSWHMLKTLRTHVSIRFLSVFPKSGAETTLTAKKVSFGKYRKLASRSRFWEFEKYRKADVDSSNSSVVPYAEPIGSEHEAEDVPIDGEIDDDEEEELDGYESPALADEDDPFKLDASSYPQAGETIPNDFLQELLRGIGKDGKDQQSNDGGAPHADSSDSEYQIFEPDSNDDDSS